MKRKRKSARKWIILFILAAAIAFSLVISYKSEDIVAEDFPPLRAPQRYHAHADFLVFINGQELDFSKPEYDAVDERMHLHIRNYMGDKVLHIESKEAELGDFFASLDMLFNSTCFFAGEEFCNNATHKLKFFVNGVANAEYDSYRLQDLDRILISYGNETDVSGQINSVTDLACIFSQKCPAPPEAENRIIYN